MTIRIPATTLNATDVMHHLIRMVLAAVPADVICVCSYQQALDVFTLIEHYQADAALPFDMAEAQDVIRQHILPSAQVNVDSLLLSGDDLDGVPFQSAWVFRLSMHDELIGLLVLFSRAEKQFSADDAIRLALPVSLIRMALENTHVYDALASQMMVSEAILETTRMIGQDPSPQNIVHVLRDYLFDAHVTGCGFLLYGPVNEDRPFGPFEYLEVVGSWEKRPGGGVPLGTKLSLNDVPDLRERLSVGEPVAFASIEDMMPHLDPAVRSLVRVSGAAAVTLLPLRSGERQLGILAVGTDGLHNFSQLELDMYRAVGEFLAISAMSLVMQQQHDRVTQGRAALLDAVTEGVVMILPDGSNGRVLTVNQRFTSIFGVAEKTAHGLLLEELLAQMQLPESVRREVGAKWFSITLHDAVTQNGEFRMVHSDGYPLDIEWYSAPVYHKDGHVLGRIYTFHNVTAERSAVRIRSEFLSRATHELRTPLTSIHGYAQFILELVGEQLPPIAREYTEIILSSAKHLRAMFIDMIEMTTADIGELRLNMQPTHLPDVIFEAIARLEFQSKKREQTVLLDVDDNLPLVHIDTDRITQVLTNLLMNAMKYSPDGSKIRVGTQHVTEQLPAGAPHDMVVPAVVVSVVDEGHGLSRSDIENIFLPFFRTEWVRTNKIEGTGLGLSVSRSIIELHRGCIWAVASTPQQPGGRFFFSLPTHTAL
jgi:two-component system sensor histidine kinase VicK